MTHIEQLIKDLCPNGVPYKTFAELGTFYGGLSGKSKSDFQDGNAKYITYLNIGNNPALRLDILETVKVGPNEKQNDVRYGDALFTGSSETPDECAMSSVLTEHPTEKIYLNSFCFGFRFYSLDGICPAFYKHYFRSTQFRQAVRRTANGTTRFNVSKKEFAKLSIPIPPMEIQERIVALLDRYSALAAELQAELQLRRKQYEHYRTRLLTPHSDTNSADKSDDCNWVSTSLGEICPILRGKRLTKSELSEDEKYPVFHGGIEPLGYYKEHNREANTVMIINVGASAGTVGYCNQDFWSSDGCFCLGKSDRVIPKFLYYLLQTRESELKSRVRYAGIPTLDGDVIKRLQVSIPSIEEQERVVVILDKFEKLMTSLSDGIPAEQAAQQKRYEYFRDLLLTFDRKQV